MRPVTDITKQDPPHHFRSYIYYTFHTSLQDNKKVLRYWNIFSGDPSKAAVNTVPCKDYEIILFTNIF
jgi:hypothetical protein